MSSERHPKRSPQLLSPRDTAVLVVDVQEKLLPLLPDSDRLVDRCRLVIEAARILQVSLMVTEQYPQGLGKTVASLAPLLPPPIEKRAFSSCGASEVVAQLTAWKVRKVLLVGIETHVCIQQTALDLLANGFATYLAADATGSRRVEDRHWALGRMAYAGVAVTTAEAAVFELTESAAAAEFKAISQLIKQFDALERVRVPARNNV